MLRTSKPHSLLPCFPLSLKVHLIAPTLCGLMLASIPVNAEVYRWVDEHGKVHFSDRAPESARNAQHVESLKIETPSVSSSTATQKSQDTSMESYRVRQQRLLDSFAADRAKREKEEARLEKQKAKQALACQRMTNRMLFRERAGRLYYEQKDGTRAYLSDAQRKAVDQRDREWLSENCS